MAKLGKTVRSPFYQTVPLVIKNVTTYSFSQFEDGTFGFWAGGLAGWYEIVKPATEYEKIFEKMSEATGMFYFAADKFRKTKKTYICASATICEDRTMELFTDVRNTSIPFNLGPYLHGY